MKSATAIAFDYRPSRWIATAVVAVTLLAVVAVAVSGGPLTLKLGLACAACACAGYSLHRFLHMGCRRATWHQAGHWRIADKDGTEHAAELDSGIVRSVWIVLRLRRTDGQRATMILGPDNSDMDTRRRLRIALARASDTKKNPVHCREPGP